jgi:hypothetical protein
MFTSYHFGHKIYSKSIKINENTIKNSPWRFVDTNELIVESKRKCPKCDKEPTSEGHDPCIANLPDVKYACCGHGIPNDAYIYFESGEIYRFPTSEEFHNFIDKYEIKKYGILRLPNRGK